jgi:hypothetical protein
VILAVGVQILRGGPVMLLDGQHPDQVGAGRKHDEHRIAIEVAAEPGADLIPLPSAPTGHIMCCRHLKSGDYLES